MKQRFMLGAYWPARRESLLECTANVRQFLARIAEIDPLLAQWYERGRSRKDALKKKIDASDASAVEALLLKGRNKYDVGGAVIEELGFKVSLWNGAASEEEEASVSVQCGSDVERISNNVIIDLPLQSPNIYRVDRACALLALVAETWKPAWAGVMSKRAMRERGFNARSPFVDWMLYVPRTVDSVEPPTRVEVLDGLGSTIIVQPDPPTGNDPEELRRVRQVEALLAE